jgi:N utilization substance protein B
MKHERRRVRSLALQSLYEVDTVGHSPQAVLARHIENNPSLSEENTDFLRTLVLGVLEVAPQLDEWIANSAPEWPVDQLAVLDRNILRMALWELAVSDETPLKVAINEAVELAKRFGSDSSPRFINGVLGTLAKREQELRHYLEVAAG